MLLKLEKPLGAPAIELTPIIDMVFLLLIFFLVATTFRESEREMQIALPVASSSAPISAIARDMIINVDASGQIILGGRRIDVEGLRATITKAVSINPQQKVTVRGDRRTPYANIVSVLDVCKTSGIQEPYLDTVATE